MHLLKDTLLIDPPDAIHMQDKVVRETTYGYLATEEKIDNTSARLCRGKRFKMLHWLPFSKFTHGDSVDHVDFNVKNNRRSNLRIIPMYVNSMRKKNSVGFLRGVYKTKSGTFYSRYSRTHIGSYNTVHEASLAYNIVMFHVFKHRGILQWYNELANPQLPGLTISSIPSHVFESVTKPHTRPRTSLYENFWKASTPVELIVGCDNTFIVVRGSIRTTTTCVRCSKTTEISRFVGMHEGPVEFFKCMVCTLRES